MTEVEEIDEGGGGGGKNLPTRYEKNLPTSHKTYLLKFVFLKSSELKEKLNTISKLKFSLKLI